MITPRRVLPWVVTAILFAPVALQAAEVGLGLQLGAGARDAISVGQSRPERHGEAIGALQLRIRYERWATGLEGWLGGSWFASQPTGFDEVTIKDQSWSVRPVVDRLFPIGDETLWSLGVGLEYGEWRSFGDAGPLSVEGPHTYFTGGVLRMGIEQRVGPVDLHGSSSQSIFGAHGTDESGPDTEVQWTGQSTAFTLGVRWVLSPRTD